MYIAFKLKLVLTLNVKTRQRLFRCKRYYYKVKYFQLEIYLNFLAQRTIET